MSQKWLKRARYDENLVVNEFWNKGYVALRIPISGAGRFCGDVLAFTPHTINLILVRRTENNNKIIFKKEEIQTVKNLAGRIASLVYPNSVQIELKAHFPKYKKWIEKLLLDWDGNDIEIKIKEK